MNDPINSYSFLTSLGMNNRWNELDFNGQYVLLAQNCRFAQEPGSAIKRQPLAYYNTSAMSTSSGMVGLYRYYSIFGPQIIGVCGSTVYAGTDSTGAMTAIRTLSNANRRTMFVTYNSLLIGSNGYDEPFVYDGGTSGITWQLGSCQAITAGGTGITATNISYAVTMDANAYICGAVSNTIASLTNQSIGLAYIPLGPAGTSDRKIYRKDSGTGGNYKLVTTISDNATTTYTDTTPSGSLGANMGATTDAIPVGAWILIYAERLFITADPNYANRIYYSEPYLPGFIQQNTNLDYMDVAKDDGDQIQGLVIQSGTMICIKQNNMRKMAIASAQSNVDPASWYAEEPFCQLGTPARYSICQTPYGIVFLSWDAWYLFSGGTLPEPIILQFDPTQILPANYNSVVTAYNDGMLYASYTSIDSGVQYPTEVMVYDMKLKQMSLDTYNAGCFASGTGVNEAGELYIGDARQGYIYKAEEGDIFSSISSLTQANSGTTAGTFIGGTENTAFIQIGAGNAPQSIPTGICLFWDDDSSSPGSGWTEITSYPYTYPVVSTVSGTTGGSSAHTHGLTGTTSNNAGPSGNSGDGNAQCSGYAHSHTVNGTSDSMFANPNYFGLRIFYKNATTTEYTFPVGSVLMWDQQTAPDGWLAYSNSNNGYLRLIAPVASAANWALSTAYTVGQYATATNPFTGQPQIYYCQVAHTSGAYDNAFNSRIGFNGDASPNIPSSGSGGTGSYPVTVGFSDDLAAGFWIAQYDSLGIMVQDTHPHSYGAVTPFLTDAAPSPNNQSDSGNLGGKNAHQHYMVGILNGASTSLWDLDRLEINFIKKLVTGETPWDGTSKNIVALFWDTGAPASPSNGWSEISTSIQTYSASTSYVAGNLVLSSGTYYKCILAGTNQTPASSPTYWTATTAPQVYIKSMSNYATMNANNGFTHSHGNAPAITTGWPTTSWGNGGFHAQTGLMHQHTVVTTSSTVSIPNPGYVSFRLWSALLGKMVIWNNASTTKYTNGLYYSPALQLNVQKFGELFYNASKLPTDSINFYFNTGTTSASLTSGIAVTMGSNTFTASSHGLSNGNRVTLTATSTPTGLLTTIVYYVISATTNTFQVSLTNGGSAVTFSGGSGVAVFPWSNEITSSDTIIAATPNTWVSYVVEFIAGDTTISNPTLTTANEFILEFSYRRSGTIAESSVEFIYSTGRMNAGEPAIDKIYRRIASDHTGASGQVQVTWATENATNAWMFDLSAFPNKWSSFFHDQAMGEMLSITYYKNDLYDFTLRQFKIQYAPQPIIM